MYTIDGYEVYEASIIDLDVSTADQDNQGYLLANGTDRSLQMGITPDGEVLIYMRTNGDPRILQDDIAEATAWCCDMGDLPQDDKARVRQGARRLLDAIDCATNIYGDNEAALVCLDWYRDKTAQVIEQLPA